MSHIERCAGCSVDVRPGGGGGSIKAEDADVGTANVDVDADADTDTDVDGAASALVVPVRNGRSKASLSLETFFGPNPGRRASSVASAWAILAKLCVP
jgi:hypothetical protein